MRPRRVPTSGYVYRLMGGNEDNDLWLEKQEVDGQNIFISVWDLEPYEREAIANGATIELYVWGNGHPPVNLGVGLSMNLRKAAAGG